METHCIPFKDTGYFSKIIVDYLEGDEKLKPFYSHAPHFDAFSKVIEEKSISPKNRSVLVEVLKSQYQKGKIKLQKFERVAENITSLAETNTYTITTGHQLCLFTGPLYFIYKIASVINLAKKLKKQYPNKNFVPVYWMATEDHDFAEINHFQFQGERFEWNTKQSGAVGRMALEGLDAIFEAFSERLPNYSTNSEQLKALFQKAYLKQDNLADATRFLVNELFADYGVVIVDGDDASLKQLFVPLVKEELLTEFSSKAVEEQSTQLAKDYKIQVNSREINLFYLKGDQRNRIVKEGKQYFINDTEQVFEESEMLEELELHPERFSPNVLLRPLYQECILPNLAYIGGGGELAYWFQLRSTFETAKLPMPMLLLRNSALWMDEKQSKYYDTLKIDWADLFLEYGVLLKKWVKQNADEELTLQEEVESFKQLYQVLATKSERVDASLEPHVQALLAKQQKSMKQLSEKLIRAERRKQTEVEDKIEHLKSKLFPNGGLQERSSNFSEVYLREGQIMITQLLESFDMPTSDFTVFKK